MSARRKNKTTLLPQVLLEKIIEQGRDAPFLSYPGGQSKTPSGSTYSQNSYGGTLRKKGNSRKVTREEARAAKRRIKAEHFAQRPQIKEAINVLKRKGDGEDRELRPAKRQKLLAMEAANIGLFGKNLPVRQKQVATSALLTEQEKQAERGKPTLVRTKAGPIIAKANVLGTKPMKRHAKTPAAATLKTDEDKEIAWLEYQLGIGSGRSNTSYKKLLMEDGLDDLFEDLEGTLGGVEDEDDDDDDRSMSRSQEEDISEEKESIDEEALQDHEVDDDNSAEMASSVDEQASDLGDMQVRQVGLSSQEDKLAHQETTTKASKYVPPHLRPASKAGDANRTRLLRQLKGLVNRLSEQNIGTIISELEQIYQQHARHDVTFNLTSMIIEAISSNSSLLDNHIALNAALVAALYRVVGIEFAASFVQELLKAYEAAYGNASNQLQDGSNTDAVIVGKDAQNLLVCITELYNFEVVACLLVYDIVRALLKQNMGELEVELLLKILRIGGKQLRQDDPLALKDIVQLVIENLSSQKGHLSSRTRFLVETLTNLKNNRIKKTDSNGADTMERMKKMLSGLSKRYHGSREALRVTLDDLRSAESKGKWWLVGAGWTGDPLVDIQRARGVESAARESSGDVQWETAAPRSAETISVPVKNESEGLLRLARAQGMNTDIRRSVFVVLMSSEDYVDACDRLSQLTLTEQQQREIVRVLVHCCGNEKTYNPYYALVGQRLLATSHAHRITTQFSLWDFLRSIGETEIGQGSGESFGSTVKSASRTRNLAKFYAWLVIRGSLSISVLRPINFFLLQPTTLGFLDMLFYDIFTGSQGNTPVLSRAAFTALWQRGDGNFPGKQTYDKDPIAKAFMPAARDPELSKGLGIYLSKFVKRRAGQGEEGEKRFLKWAVGIARDVLEVGSTVQTTVRGEEMDWDE